MKCRISWQGVKPLEFVAEEPHLIIRMDFKEEYYERNLIYRDVIL